MITTYRRILVLPGAAFFSASGLVARLPISMLGLGLVFLVEGATGSYGLAGAVSGVALIANASMAIVQGRLIDRLGQSKVLPCVITLWGLSLVATIWSVQADWPIALTYLFAALSGGSMPSVGTCVRARWSYLLRERPADLQTAFALEAVADETVFISGPILVTLLATAWHPVAGLGAALIGGLLGTYVFSALRSTEPPPTPALEIGQRREAMPWATVLPLTVVCGALGVLFGSAEVTTVAFAEEQGAKAYAGVLLAIWATGSLLAGLLTGAITWQRSTLYRLRIGALAMSAAMIPLAFIDSMLVMGAVLFFAGFAIAPTLIAAMSLSEQTLPKSRLTEGMAFLQTGIVAGVAPGAALAGAVIDAYGASPAYLVSVAGGTLALIAALATKVRSTFTVGTHEHVA